MNKIETADIERLKKIVKNYQDLKRQIDVRNITREQVLDDQFIQWAITTPLFNIGEHTNNLSKALTFLLISTRGRFFPPQEWSATRFDKLAGAASERASYNRNSMFLCRSMI
jgi:hypothetical protein